MNRPGNWKLERGLLFLCFFFALPQQNFAQTKNKTYSLAEDAFFNEEFETATAWFSEYLQLNPEDKKAQYYAEISSLLSTSPTGPLEKLLGFEETFGQSDKFFFYWLGRVYAARYDYGLALDSWNKFLALKAYKSKIITEETRLFVKDAEIKKDLLERPTNFNVYELAGTINTEYSEFNPILFDGESKLMVSTVREGADAAQRKLKSTVYFFERLERNKWSDAISYPAFEALKENIINVQLYDNESKLLLYYNSRKGDLYLADKSNGEWLPPRQLDIVSQKGEQGSGFMFANGNSFIYSSESKNSGNGLDLFIINKSVEGEWSEPVPIVELNTPLDEDSPFVSSDGATIYFSSTGHGSIGGFDVFKSSLDPVSGRWSQPQNMGFPINTPADEIFFKLNADGKSGLLSSNRAGTKGGYDAYLFIEDIKIPLNGKVIAGQQDKPIPDVTIKAVPVNEYLATTSSTTDQNGSFNLAITVGFDYTLEFHYQGKLVKSEKLMLTDEKETYGVNRNFDIEIPEMMLAEISPGTVRAGAVNGSIDEYTELSDLGKKFSKGNRAILRNIYFDPGSDYISSGFTPELREIFQILNDNPNLKIEISGHTDALEAATETSNLSLRRARSVGSYLIQRRIDYRRIKEVGIGDKRPLASNDDELEGRELNRRIEILIVE